MGHGDPEHRLAPPVHRVREAPFEMCRVAPMLRPRLAAQEGRDRPAVRLQRHLGTDELADRRQHVDRLGHRLDHGATACVRLRARVNHDEGDVVALVPVAEFLQQPVVAPHFPMVAGQDDEGRLGEPAAFQVGEQRRQPVVHLALCPVIGGADLPPLPLVGGDAHAGDRHGQRTQRVQRGLLLGRGAAGERSDGLRRVEVVVPDRVPPRRVGTDEGGVHEERPFAVALQPLDHGFGEEGRLRELRREPCRRPRRPVVVGAGETLHRQV